MTVQNSRKITAEKGCKAMCKVKKLEKEHFIKYSYNSKDNLSLLIYDNHESHINLVIFEVTKANGVHILTLLPDLSHWIQPLDVGLY
ncbi:hypothetical protein PR048_003550 [Dryococelus australis]|uniref:DDE-1 domain-containing protein n=1 Tax=Dryococelus australis TaxID=614101 RepID=A0ABQ9INC2_9NEOP|nr:hypothetical protein PR048_003550 [Dryococelus australis]